MERKKRKPQKATKRNKNNIKKDRTGLNSANNSLIPYLSGEKYSEIGNSGS